MWQVEAEDFGKMDTEDRCNRATLRFLITLASIYIELALRLGCFIDVSIDDAIVAAADRFVNTAYKSQKVREFFLSAERTY